MVPVRANTFRGALDVLESMIVEAPAVQTRRWQGRDVSADPSARTHELVNALLEVPLAGVEDLDRYREDVRPNLPWADDHFWERVGGEPLNPGVQWANWPWAASADTFREGDRFNHTYMERLWPKYARQTWDGRLNDLDPVGQVRRIPDQTEGPRHGITWCYGDLWDLVELLAHEPDTRQAWMPLFHPDDTGRGDGDRKPCTLGYQFLVRNGELNVYYPLRSCDLARHARDDCYLTVRLLLWVLDRCRDLNPDWSAVTPGTYLMHATSLHVFENDWIALRKQRGY